MADPTITTASEDASSASSATTSQQPSPALVVADNVATKQKVLLHPGDIPASAYTTHVYGGGYTTVAYNSWETLMDGIRANSSGGFKHLIVLTHAIVTGPFDETKNRAGMELMIGSDTRSLDEFQASLYDRAINIFADRLDFEGCNIGLDPVGLLQFKGNHRIAEVHAWSWFHSLYSFFPGTDPATFQAEMPFLPKDEGGNTYSQDELVALAGTELPLEFFTLDDEDRTAEELSTLGLLKVEDGRMLARGSAIRWTRSIWEGLAPLLAKGNFVHVVV